MKLQYGHRKEKIRIDEIERAEIFPSDGSALQVGKEAIIDLHVEYYDALVTSCEAFLPVAKSGYLKLRADGDTSAPSVPTLKKLTDTCDYLFLAFYDDLSRRSAFFASHEVDVFEKNA